MSALAEDLRHAWRSLRRRPGFSAGVVLVLALGVGANAAVYTFVDAMLLEPLPFPRAEELVLLTSRETAAGDERQDVSTGDFLAWSQAETLASTALWVPWYATLREEGDAESLRGIGVTESFFATLGVGAERGRVLLPADAADDAPKTIVLSHGLWRHRFGGDPAILGRLLELNGEDREVVGVLPSTFRFPTEEVGFFVPVRLDPATARHDGRYLHAVARLGPGAGADTATAELAAISARLAAERPETNEGWTGRAEPLHDVVVELARPALLMLQGLVAVVLLVATVDVTNLLLARARGRRRELAVRGALGAGRGRLLRQLLLEATLLALAGAAAGGAAAFAGVRGLLALVPASLTSGDHEQAVGHAFPRLAEVAVDGSVLAVAIVAALAASLVAGMVAALSALRGDPREGLASGARAADGASGGLRWGLVAAELTLASVLLVAAGLLVRSFQAVLDVDPGFRSRDVLTMQLSGVGGHDPAARAASMRLALEAAAATPGVTAAGFSTTLPFTNVEWYEEVDVVGDEDATLTTDEVLYHAASPGYFRTLGVPLLAGRAFAPEDDAGAPGVLIVNRAFAERYLGADPVGRRILLRGEEEPFTVVGVVGDTHQAGLDLAPDPAVYASYAQRTPWFMNLAVRGRVPPAQLVRPVQEAIRAVSPGQPFRDVRLLEERIADATSPRRFQTVLVGAFAVLALVLAAMGVYGLVAYFVVARRRELGVRMALGASRGAILGLVLRQGLALAAGGGLVGLAAAAAGSRLLRHLLYGVDPLDAVTFVSIPLLLVAVAVLASYLPARRAARLPPADVLRGE